MNQPPERVEGGCDGWFPIRVCQGPDEGSIKFAAIINFHESSNQDRDENQLAIIIKSTPYHVAEIIKCAWIARLLSIASAGTNQMPYSLILPRLEWITQ
jgi:hypothetical protein